MFGNDTALHWKGAMLTSTGVVARRDRVKSLKLQGILISSFRQTNHVMLSVRCERSSSSEPVADTRRIPRIDVAPAGSGSAFRTDMEGLDAGMLVQG